MLVATEGALATAPVARTEGPIAKAGEALALLSSPGLAFFALRLLVMAPVVLPDPSMHTTFIIDPHSIFMRFTALFTPTARLREGARVGFLVPARIDYLLFGAVPGFYATRYLFAVVAIVPAYLLLKRLYGSAAGVIAVVTVLACPVVIVAWGTDYPDSAAVSYLLGGLACLLMPSEHRRRLWLGAATGLFTLAVWAHGMSAVLVIAAAIGYLGVRLVRDRAGLLADGGIALCVAGSVTGLLALGSGLLIGHYDFISPTWKAFGYLNQTSQTSQWHSSNWRWAPYVTYLLVPPAVLGGFAAVFARRLKAIPTPQLTLGVIGVLQVVLCVYFQFWGNLQTLEMHYFSSTIWSGTCLVLAVTLAEIARPLLLLPRARWLAPLAVLAVPYVYEAHPHVPAFGWLPYGALAALVLVAVALLGRVVCARGAPLKGATPGALAAGGSRETGGRAAAPAHPPPADFLPANRSRHLVTSLVSVVSILGVAGAALFLTVVPVPSHPVLPGTLPPGRDPVPVYASALGGNGAVALDYYRITARLPGFVGPPSYRDEQLLMWWPIATDPQMVEPSGIYHSGYQSLPSEVGEFVPADAATLAQRKPAQLLLISDVGWRCVRAFEELRSYHPRIVRQMTTRAGPVVVHYWLLDLGVYAGQRALGP